MLESKVRKQLMGQRYLGGAVFVIDGAVLSVILVGVPVLFLGLAMLYGPVASQQAIKEALLK